MIRFLIRTAIYFVAAFIAIIVADIVLAGFSVALWWSYVVVALIYGVAQAALEPFLHQVMRRTAPLFVGGVGIGSAYVALGGHEPDLRSPDDRRRHHGARGRSDRVAGWCRGRVHPAAGLREAPGPGASR